LDYRELDTPSLILDLDLMEKNIDKMSDFFKGKRSKLRPHVKNHKTPIIAKKEIRAGAVGVAVAKLEEAEVFASSGIKNIMLMNQIVSEPKIDRLAKLARDSEIIVAVDNAENVRQLSLAAEKKKVKLGVVVELDIGYHRAGVRPGKEALELARIVGSSRGLDFKGLAGYEGHLSLMRNQAERKAKDKIAMKSLVETRDLLQDDGINVEIVSAGGTGTYDVAGNYPGITEVQAGSYVTMDVVYRDCGIDFDCALSVLSTVTSAPSSDRAILDAGLKTVTDDQGLPELKGVTGIQVTKLSAEHVHLKLERNHTPLKIGEKVEVLPSDTDTTINLHEQFYGVRDGEIEVVWPILARGKSR
jgi:D-serine deaminase-like pyridoxal phosphate-dependent protein